MGRYYAPPRGRMQGTLSPNAGNAEDPGTPSSPPVSLTGGNHDSAGQPRQRAVRWGAAIGAGVLLAIVLGCIGSLPWMTSPAGGSTERTPRYNAGSPREGRLPPWWWPARPDAAQRIAALADKHAFERVAAEFGQTPSEIMESRDPTVLRSLRDLGPYSSEKWRYALGTDSLGRSLFFRCLAGGGISIVVGIAAATISVLIGTLYGALAGYAGGRLDALLMRTVDVLYGLPYVLLVVLLAVAVDSVCDRYVASRVEAASELRNQYFDREFGKFAADQRTEELRRQLAEEALERYGSGELSLGARNLIGLVTLLVAIGGVSWLTMARVVRGQVLSLRKQPFVEAARSIGSSPTRIFFRHLLPNLVAPISVYATLTVPQAILQESFLSFLGIGVKPPLPSWGNLASEGLSELNPYQSDWWLLLFPCLLLGVTLLALNFVGEELRERFDPRGRQR